MASTVRDLIKTAVTAAENQAKAQSATKDAVATIAAQRAATPPEGAPTAGGQNAGNR